MKKVFKLLISTMLLALMIKAMPHILAKALDEIAINHHRIDRGIDYGK